MKPWIRFLLSLRLLMIAALAWVPVRSGHMWRQVDTMATVVRYFNRISFEGASGWHWLLPAVLDSGDQMGIMPMECPLLNLALVPGFALGDRLFHSVYAGLVGMMLLLGAYLVGLLAATWRVWRGKTIAGVPAGDAVLALPVVSFMLPYFGKLIPDVVAGLLVILALGLLWDEGPARRRWLAFLFATVGLLIKPTAVIGPAILLLAPDLWATLRRAAAPFVAATAVAGAYYVFGTKAITDVGQQVTKFAVSARPPLESFLGIVSRPLDAAELLDYGLFFPFGLLALLLAVIYLARRYAAWRSLPWGLMAVLALQVCAIAALDGPHVFAHSYYFVTAAFTASLLLLALWSWIMRLAPRRLGIGIGAVLLILWGVHFGEVSMLDFQSRVRPGVTANELFHECDDLRGQAPDWPWQRGVVFRSSDVNFPLLGLCFGERVGSNGSPYALYEATATLPADCQAQSRSSHLVLARCMARAP